MKRSNHLWKKSDWDLAARLGKVVEPIYIDENTPTSGIECPNVTGKHHCRAHLHDDRLVIVESELGKLIMFLNRAEYQHGRLMHPVRCGVCKWEGWREVGIDVGYENGKDL